MQRQRENYFVKALREAKIQELTESYSKRGFGAEKNVRVDNQEVDLLLRNPATNQTLAFEVEILPVSKENFDHVEQLRQKLAELGYQFRLVTISPPTEYKIEIDWFDNELSNYITHREPPENIEEKASHVSYGPVSTDIESITINGTQAWVRATGTISVTLQFGSNSDLVKNKGLLVSETFPFAGEFELDLSKKEITWASIEVDDSDWYE